MHFFLHPLTMRNNSNSVIYFFKRYPGFIAFMDVHTIYKFKTLKLFISDLYLLLKL